MVECFIVSGANGFLGKKVVSILADQGKQVIGLCRNIEGMIGKETVRYVSNCDFLSAAETYMDGNTVFIHLAFARANRGAYEIAGSMDFTKELLMSIKDCRHLSRLVYISSQGIYGKSSKIRTTMNPAEPDTIYTMAKYAAEKMVEMSFDDDFDYCILRLDSVVQSQNLISALAKSAIEKGIINIIGGKQLFSYIDCDDAAAAIVTCAQNQKKSNRHIYNLGPNKMRVSLAEIAEIVRRVGALYGDNIEIVYREDDTEMWAGMDSEDFSMDYGWKPQYNIEQMIQRVYGEMRRACVLEKEEII